MRRLVSAALLSLVLYLWWFGAVARFPLSRGLLEAELAGKSARLAALGSPKIVILAGSNGPYSHSCLVFAEAFALPCENAGLAVGFGLDEIFTRYAPALRPGDIVYMPMELRQYAASAYDYETGPDGQMLWRDDKATLTSLPPARVAGAFLCCKLLDFFEALLEAPLARVPALNPAAILAREYAANGDRIDNTMLPVSPVFAAGADPTAQAMANGYGARLIAAFVRAQRARGVIVIGGLPTQAGGALSANRRAALRQIYGADFFVELADDSRYPPADFTNSPDHLSQPCQLMHSLALVAALAPLLHRPVFAVPNDIQREGAKCPSALRVTAQN
jgi:hypothetical protein